MIPTSSPVKITFKLIFLLLVEKKRFIYEYIYQRIQRIIAEEGRLFPLGTLPVSLISPAIKCTLLNKQFPSKLLRQYPNLTQGYQ